MAHRYPGQTPNLRPPENAIPTVMGAVSLPSPMGLGMQPGMFHSMHQTGSWSTAHLQQPTVAGQSGFTPLSSGVMAPQQIPSQPHAAGGKDRNYLQQQQKLRAMASSFKKPGPLSADSLIEDLLQQKETFTMRPQQAAVSVVESKNSTIQAAMKPQSSLESHGVSDLNSTELHPSAVPTAGAIPGSTALPLWLLPDAYDLLPAVYRHVWELTKIPAADGRELVDTGRIFNILLTSGLPRDALGYIWNLANTIIPGVLTRPELNVALALVALAQSGWRNFTSSAVLSMVQQPPVPNLQLESITSPTPVAVTQPSAQSTLQITSNLPLQPSSTLPAFQSDPIVAISQTETDMFSFSNEKKMPEKVINPTPAVIEPKITIASEPNLLDDNDDFTDFQSAAPTLVQPTTVVNPQISHLSEPDTSKSSTFFSPRDSPLGFNSFESPPATPVVTKPKGSREVGSRLANYSFGAPSSNTGTPPNAKRNSAEFKDDLSLFTTPKVEDNLFPKCSIKPPPSAPENSNTNFAIKPPDEKGKLPTSSSKPPEEDKYSALRDLCFDSKPENEEQHSAISEQKQNNSSIDDFGDFLSAGSNVDDSFAELATREKTPVSTIAAAPSNLSTTEPASQEWSANFDDFVTASNSTWTEEQNITVFPATETVTSQTEEDEEDFGDFVGPSTISSLPNLNRVKETSTITPDTQSVASLELGGFDNLSLGGAGAGSSPDGGLSELRGGLESVQWEAASVALQEEGREWRQCLHSCLALLQAAAQILGAIDDPHVAEEVVTSREGEDYLANLLEVYCVTQRISAASHQLLPASRQSLEPLLAEVESAWNTLSPFLERSNIEVQKDRKWSVSINHTTPCCAICLVLVDESEGSTALVRAGQHCYHAACANLWLNCIDTMLPNIIIP